jgi:hypothetical protein
MPKFLKRSGFDSYSCQSKLSLEGHLQQYCSQTWDHLSLAENYSKIINMVLQQNALVATG